MRLFLRQSHVNGLNATLGSASPAAPSVRPHVYALAALSPPVILPVVYRQGKSERMGVHNVGSQSPALSPRRAYHHRPHFHIRFLSVEHRLALRLDLGSEPLPLPDDDHGNLRDARRVPSDRLA